MKIYQLTQVGKRLARNTRNPDTVGWRIVHHLDKVGHATPDQMSQAISVSEGEINLALVKLRNMNPPVVEELSHGSF